MAESEGVELSLSAPSSLVVMDEDSQIEGEMRTKNALQEMVDLYFPGLLMDEEEEDNSYENPVPPEVAEKLDELMKTLEDAVESVNTPTPSPSGTKRKRTGFFNEFLVRIETGSKDHGFSNQQLDMIWDLVTHEESAFTCKIKQSLVFAMVPREKVDEVLLEKIVCWIENSKENGVKVSIVKAVLLLLNMYFENNLVEEAARNNRRVLKTILRTETEPLVIPWKMELVRKLSTPGVVEKTDIEHMMSMLKIKKIKKTQVEDISKSIQHAQVALKEPEVIAVKKVRMRPLTIPSTVASNFAKDVPSLHALETAKSVAKNLFPEFQSNICEDGTARQASIIKVLEMVDRDEDIGDIGFNEEFLASFQVWLKECIEKRLFYVQEPLSAADVRRYNFIFETSLTICKTQNKGIPELNAWILDYIPLWNFYYFESFILNLIAYLVPSDILSERTVKEGFEDALTNQFQYNEEIRMELWCSIESLASNWVRLLEGDREVFEKGLDWVLGLMEELADAMILTAEVISVEANPRLVSRIVKFYINLLKVSNQIPSMDSLKPMIENRIPKCLPALIHLSNCEEIVNLGKELFKSGPSFTESARALDAAVSGVLDMEIIEGLNLTGVGTEGKEVEENNERQDGIQLKSPINAGVEYLSGDLDF